MGVNRLQFQPILGKIGVVLLELEYQISRCVKVLATIWRKNSSSFYLCTLDCVYLQVPHCIRISCSKREMLSFFRYFLSVAYFTFLNSCSSLSLQFIRFIKFLFSTYIRHI